MAIRQIGAAELTRRLGQVGTVLRDCVADGASVGFLESLSAEAAEDFWRGIAAEVEKGACCTFVALQDDEAVGTVLLLPAKQPNQPHRADFAKLLVHRRARRQGLARALMAAAEAEAEAEARRRSRWLLTLDTIAGDPAEALYLKLGYKRAGVIPDYAMWPNGRLGDTVVFYKKLGDAGGPFAPVS